MTTPPAIIFVWRDGAMEPIDRFSRLAERSFTSGHAYKMIVAEERRSGEQNNKLWAMLSEIAEQKEHCGRKYTADNWKCLFMHAWGQEVQFLPALDNSTFVPYPYSSSKLSKKDMTELIEWIGAWAAQNGVVFRNEPVAA